jgi:protocatechuate 3,4-dioxygenase beta subunit
MDADDILKGRFLSRREILSLLSVAGGAFLVACSGDNTSSPQTAGSTAGRGEVPTNSPASSSSNAGPPAMPTPIPSCVVLPDLTEGPYFVDTQLDRSDIRSDPTTGAIREGAELTLTLNVLSVGGGSCAPMSGAMVDIWQCDALGVYSGVQDSAQGFNTVNQKFLRGFQVSDATGQVKFTTVYPGWYPGRATHIHFKIRKGSEEFTSQFFFDDTLSSEINNTLAPYSQKGANGRTQNATDGIYRQSNGMLLLDVQKSGSGYAAMFDIGIQA